MQVLVIGGSGFIGREVTMTLADAGHSVVATWWTQPVWWQHPRIESFQCNVVDPASVQRALKFSDPDAIVYCASRMRTLKTQTERDALRLKGVRTVCQAIGTIPFLYLSSTKVLTAPDSPYGKTQAHCESVVCQHGGEWMRLPAVYSWESRPWLWLVSWVAPSRVHSVEEVAANVQRWLTTLRKDSDHARLCR